MWAKYVIVMIHVASDACDDLVVDVDETVNVSLILNQIKPVVTKDFDGFHNHYTFQSVSFFSNMVSCVVGLTIAFYAGLAKTITLQPSEELCCQ